MRNVTPPIRPFFSQSYLRPRRSHIPTTNHNGTPNANNWVSQLSVDCLIFVTFRFEIRSNSSCRVVVCIWGVSVCVLVEVYGRSSYVNTHVPVISYKKIQNSRHLVLHHGDDLSVCFSVVALSTFRLLWVQKQWLKHRRQQTAFQAALSQYLRQDTIIVLLLHRQIR